MSRSKARAARALRAAAVAAPPSGSPVDTKTRRGARRYVRNEAIDATPSTVVSIFAHTAATGDTSRQTQFYKHCRLLDSRLDELAARRAGSPSGLPLMWKAPPGYEADPVALENATMLSRLWNATNRTHDAIGHLNHAPLEGHAFLAYEWVIDAGTGWHRPAFKIEQSHSSQVAWNIDTMEPWWSATPGTAITKDTIPSETCFPLASKPDQFIFYAPLAGRADDPWHRGALRACVIRSLLKRFNVGAWASMLERWGQPQIIATVDADATQSANTTDADDIGDQVDQALAALGRDWSAQLPKGVTFTAIPVSVSESLHKNFIDWAAREDSIAILGQNLTTESSGAGHAGVVGHRRVEHEILEMDATGLNEVLTDQWAERVIRYNRPGTPVPYACFVTAPKMVVTATEYQTRAYTTDEYRTSRGDEPMPDGKGAGLYEPAVAGGSGLVGTPPAAESSKPSDTGEPGPSKPEVSTPGLTSLPAAETAPDSAAAAPAEKAADTALTGIQGERLEAIVLNVKNDVYPASVGKLLISGTFPGLDPTFVDALMAAVTAAGITPIAPPPPPENPSAAT